MRKHSAICGFYATGTCRCSWGYADAPLAAWERELLTGERAHTEGFGEVTFIRTDGRKVVRDNVRVDSIGVDYGLSVVSMEVEDQDAPVHMPFIESWTVEYRL